MKKKSGYQKNMKILIKKKLAKLKHYKANLPRLIDCSNVYGDDYYSKDDLSDVDKQIEEVENKIAENGS